MGLARPYKYWSSVSISRNPDSSDHTTVTNLLDVAASALNPSDLLERTRLSYSLKATVSGNLMFLPYWFNEVELVAGVWYDKTGEAGVTTNAPSPFSWIGGYNQNFIVHERLLPTVESYDPTNFSMVVRWKMHLDTVESHARREGDGINVASLAVVHDGFDRSGKLNTATTHNSYWLGYDLTISCLFSTDVPPP